MSQAVEAYYDAIDDGTYALWQESLQEEAEASDSLIQIVNFLGVNAVAQLLVHQAPTLAANLQDALSFAIFDESLNDE
jgi:hypothetical protein